MTADLLPALDAFLEAAREVQHLRTVTPLENRLERSVKSAFREQERRFLSALGRQRRRWDAALQESAVPLREAVEPIEWEPLFTTAEVATLQLFVRPLSTVASAALLAGARQAIADIGVEVSFNLENPRAVAYLRTAPIRVAGINATTREEIRRILVASAEQGLSYDQVAKLLRRKFVAFRTAAPQKHIRSRAHLIAVTEVGDAYSAGTMAVGRDLQASGIAMQKRWWTAGDERVDDVCSSNAAQDWIPFDDSFGSGHDAPTAHVACRCNLETRAAPTP